MDVLKILAELRVELERVESAIRTLERIAADSNIKRRGRPPKWMSSVSTIPVVKKRTVSPAARERMAEAQKRRWAAKQAFPKTADSK